ncbi:MAG: hypothetical protein WA414_18645 [Acidobacteriaceae bacterium]
MHRATGVRFPHRHNADGTYDSICPACYATVATEDEEAKLRPHEMAHVCDMAQLDQGRQENLPQASIRSTK